MYPVAGSRCSTQRKRLNMKKRKEGTREKSQQRGIGGDISAYKQDRRKEGTREKEQQQGGWRKSFSEHKNEKHLEGFRTII